LKDKLLHWIHQKHGKFTEEMALEESSLGIGKLPKRILPDRLVRMICGYCSTGCSVDIHIKEGEPVNLTPTQDYPVNLGEACPKGWEALTPLKANDRAIHPLLRNQNGQMEKVDWAQAMETFVNRFVQIQQTYGKESVAFLSTGQITTEEMAFLGALAKFGMGMLHGDGNTRQCMATSVVAYKESFGFDAPPYTYKDFEESDVLVFIGANPCIAHPIMWQRVAMNIHDPRIVVVDPRKTETAMAATRHYALKPKSDLTLLYGLMHILIRNGWIDHGFIDRYTVGFHELKEHVRAFVPEYVSRETGLTVEEIQEFAASIHGGRRVSFWWTMGVNQSYEGVRTAQAIINLALMTGNIGRPGTGANSITGQCNAMGSRLFSNTTNLLGGHDFMNPAHRKKMAELLDIDEERIPQYNSLAYDQIVEGIVQNKIKGLWVIATNPLHSWIHQKELKTYLRNLEFLVVQDMYHTTETAQMADLLLPAAGWGEKEGSFINSERRIGLIKKVAQAPGEALADFYIFKLIARYWGCERMFRQWESPEAVFQILKKISKGQPCDITGIKDYMMIERLGGIQWPFREGDELVSHERRLFEDGRFYHNDGKARFIFEQIRSNPEPTSAEYPFELLTGRGTSSQWHTQTRTGKSKILQKMYPKDVYVEINPEDARRLNFVHNQWVYVATRRARIWAQASLTPTVKPGQIFIPMHYPETNQLTFPAVDPYSRQPSYKTCAARISRNPYTN
jgi:assimilatory nitrate reductase catalytic subunit